MLGTVVEKKKKEQKIPKNLQFIGEDNVLKKKKMVGAFYQ